MTMWLVVEGARTGPFPAATVRAAYLRGELAADAMSWQPGEPGWCSLGRRWGGTPPRVPGIAAVLAIALLALAGVVVPWLDIPPLRYADAQVHTGVVIAAVAMAIAVLGVYLHRGGARVLARGCFAAAVIASLIVPSAALLLLSWRVDRERRADPDATMTLDADGRVLRIEGFVGASFVGDFDSALSRAPALERIDIDSPGGLVVDALEVATRIGERALRVRAVGECSSACVLLWAASPERELEVSTAIGLHQVSWPGDLPETIRESSIAEHEPTSLALLRAAGFSDALLARRAETPSDELATVDALKLLDEGVRMTVVDARGEPLGREEVFDFVSARRPQRWQKGYEDAR